MSFALLLTTGSAFAQKNIVPEYTGQVAVLNADSTITVLEREKSKMKTKSTMWGMIPIPGSGMLDKAKGSLVIKGKESPTKVEGKVTLIFNAGENTKAPSDMFGVIKFEVGKKDRSYVILETSMSGITTNVSFSDVLANVKKYGTDCYIINFGKLEPGEYGIITSGFSEIYTFSVK